MADSSGIPCGLVGPTVPEFLRQKKFVDSISIRSDSGCVPDRHTGWNRHLPVRHRKATMSNNDAQTVADTDMLVTAILHWHGDGGTDAELQSVFRSIHQGRRGKVMIGAQLAVMSELDQDSMMALLELLSNLPTATTSRTVRHLTDDEADMIRERILDCIDPDVIDDDEFLQDAQSATCEKVIRFVQSLSIGNSRTTYDVEPTDVVPAGTVLTGNHKDGVVSCILNADNTVTMDGQDYGSLSAAAGVVLGRNQNGWGWWRHNGTLLATLRDS